MVIYSRLLFVLMELLIENRTEAVYVFMQIISNFRPHWVQNEVDAFSTCKLCGRHEITIACHEDKLVHLSLVRH